MKILVIDDEPMILKVIEFKLKKEGYEVIISSDGRDAISKIEIENPDLIITDILLPFISGLEILVIVKEKLKLETPIIVLSGLGKEDDIVKAFELGTDDYLTKPFSPKELSIRIKKLLNRK